MVQCWAHKPEDRPTFVALRDFLLEVRGRSAHSGGECKHVGQLEAYSWAERPPVCAPRLSLLTCGPFRTLRSRTSCTSR